MDFGNGKIRALMTIDKPEVGYAEGDWIGS